MDVAAQTRAEATEAELTRLIEKRAGDGDPDAREELWKRSVGRHDASRRAENRAARYAFHAGQAERLRRAMTDLVERHEREAMKLLEEET